MHADTQTVLVVIIRVIRSYMLLIQVDWCIMSGGLWLGLTSKPRAIRSYMLLIQVYWCIMSGGLWLGLTSKPARGRWNTAVDLFRRLFHLHSLTLCSVHWTLSRCSTRAISIAVPCSSRPDITWHTWRNCLVEIVFRCTLQCRQAISNTSPLSDTHFPCYCNPSQWRH